MATYTNRPICKACQLAELTNHGLVANDDSRALDYLGSINYFRFACYLQPFEVNRRARPFGNIHQGHLLHKKNARTLRAHLLSVP